VDPATGDTTLCVGDPNFDADIEDGYVELEVLLSGPTMLTYMVRPT